MRQAIPRELRAIVQASIAMIAAMFNKVASGYYEAIDRRRALGERCRRDTEDYLTVNSKRANPKVMWTRKMSSPQSEASSPISSLLNTRPYWQEPHHSIEHRWDDRNNQRRF